MKTFFSFLVVLLPAAALAHTDHGQQAFSIGHYFTGTHFAPTLAAVLVLCAAGVAFYRYTRR